MAYYLPGIGLQSDYMIQQLRSTNGSFGLENTTFQSNAGTWPDTLLELRDKSNPISNAETRPSVWN